jgi:hypothetical protein
MMSPRAAWKISGRKINPTSIKMSIGIDWRVETSRLNDSAPLKA